MFWRCWLKWERLAVYKSHSDRPKRFPNSENIWRGAGHFGHKTLRHRDTSAPQNWCRSLRRITGGAVCHRNCPGSKCPGFSSITALVSKCPVTRCWCRSVLRPVPKCPRESWCRSVLWPKCPVTIWRPDPSCCKQRKVTGWTRKFNTAASLMDELL